MIIRYIRRKQPPYLLGHQKNRFYFLSYKTTKNFQQHPLETTQLICLSGTMSAATALLKIKNYYKMVRQNFRILLNIVAPKGFGCMNSNISNLVQEEK